MAPVISVRGIVNRFGRQVVHDGVDLEVARGVTHDFIKMGRVLKEAHRALDAAATALREALSP